ncbi:hypothetical protein OVW19_29255, partial [Klebsiella pneumoniae]|uniref:hypothetical protein n=1 Tax=Klebsiella pneumoniae TaxID=573 RepID=UPI00226E64B3
PAFPFYIGTQLTIALVAILGARHGAFARWGSALWLGMAIAICAVLVSAPVTVSVFGGVTLSGATAINAVMFAAGRQVWEAVLAGSA